MQPSCEPRSEQVYAGPMYPVRRAPERRPALVVQRARGRSIERVPQHGVARAHLFERKVALDV